jgi:hypothetical protein
VTAVPIPKKSFTALIKRLFELWKLCLSCNTAGIKSNYLVNFEEQRCFSFHKLSRMRCSSNNLRHMIDKKILSSFLEHLNMGVVIYKICIEPKASPLKAK